MKCLILSIFICILIVSGCSYSLRMNQYPHLRNVAIFPFEDNTVELYLAEDLRSALISSFQRDGRLRTVYDDPDSQLEGEIVEYSNTVYGYDVEQNIEEYLLKIVFNITFTDLVRNNVILENNSLNISERYYPQSTEDVKIKTEEEARNKIFEELFKFIVRNSLEAW